MAATPDLALAGDMARAQEPAPVPCANPIFTTGSGLKLDAGQVVMSLARDLNTDRIDLPGFPDVVARIHRALADDGTSARDLVRLVASEPVLAAKLLQIANSAAFNKSGHEVSDLKSAINALGFNLIRGQANTFALRQMEQQQWLRPIRPVLADIWKTSNGVAAACFAVAKRVPGVLPDEALTAGLFHLIGKLYLFAKARQASLNPAEIADWEKALNDWHTSIARTLMDHWRIPSRVTEAVENQNAIFDADNKDLAPLTRILCGAKLHYRLRKPNAPPEPDAEAALARLRINGQPFGALYEAAHTDLEALRTTLD